MFRPRVMPCLLLQGKGLVKTIKFKDPTYIGDPINAVRIFNDKETDELIFLDITASREKRSIYIDIVKQIGDECYMPFAVGGGINSIQKIREILSAGAEKVVINSFAVENPDFIKEASNIFGNQSIIVSIDVKKKLFGKYEICTMNGRKASGIEPISFAKLVEEKGAGEILINSIGNDGTGMGYDINLIKCISDSVNIPVIACGGAGNFNHFAIAVNEGHASAVAAGSLFVFHGRKKAVLISYPKEKELEKIFENIY